MPIRTPEDAREWRQKIDTVLIPAVRDKPAEVNEVTGIIKPWRTGSADAPVSYAAGDVRTENGIPYKCNQAHTHHGEADWNPSAAPALWSEYHGTSPETARRYKQPSGAHDAYMTNEYCLWDGTTYRCKTDNTVWSPTDYPAAWERI